MKALIMRFILISIVLFGLLIGFRVDSSAQTPPVVVHEPAPMDPQWMAPYPPFRIAGDLYYVGTADLACYLITSSWGHILINTGLAASAGMIEKNVAALGFRYNDIRILLTSQAHFDHVGAMAEVQRKTGARFFVNAPDTAVIHDGGRSDYYFGGDRPSFAPVRIDSVLDDGATVKLGNNTITMLSHPGHTKGSCSYLFDTHDSSRKYRILIANLPSIIIDKPFASITSYPNMQRDYARSFASLDTVKFDLWVAAHASQFNLHGLRQPADPYRPEIFGNKEAYRQSLYKLRAAFDKKVK